MENFYINKYDYLLYRVYYSNGYRTEPKFLPSWIYLTITTDGHSKYVTVYSEIHINKEVRLNPSYSCDFTDREIIKDISAKIHNSFLN